MDVILVHDSYRIILHLDANFWFQLNEIIRE